MTPDVTYDQFLDAYNVIMHYIDDKPHSRKLFHTLLSYHLSIIRGEEE